jgi:hypothetical protein
MLHRRGPLVLLSLLVGLLPAALQGQFAQRSSISGFVTDSSKAAIVGAKVTLRDLDRNQTQTTTMDSSGQYTFSDLTIGHYVVHAEQPGFRPLESQPVDLETCGPMRPLPPLKQKRSTPSFAYRVKLEYGGMPAAWSTMRGTPAGLLILRIWVMRSSSCQVV